ncbi:DUF3889 domain-containing protein [Paenibacillus sp. Marseille-Q4541]|uniref:DUF3889 domain-containing protein n=1 Tax=Paenibacillus sp. Marseille-Q4541 TaxID=2831522 RepID=UPI001BA5AC04|nr:DUF3889 domain-containing protein [Paenibacillus sp. Marseille-Q4541]
MKYLFGSLVKRRIIISSLLMILCSSSVLFLTPAPQVHAEPGYAKWGAIAVTKAQSKYGASVKDYAHIGRTSLSDSMAEEKFRLLMKKEDKEFTIQVTVRFNSQTNELASVDFSKVD